MAKKLNQPQSNELVFLGLEGVKKRLANDALEQKIAALTEALLLTAVLFAGKRSVPNILERFGFASKEFSLCQLSRRRIFQCASSLTSPTT